MTTGESVKTNVLILGSGAAGVTAAIEAAEAGADVIVQEEEDHLVGAAPGLSCHAACFSKHSRSSLEPAPSG